MLYLHFIFIAISSHAHGAMFVDKTPRESIPSTIEDQLEKVEDQFQSFLTQFCSQSICYSKGCRYQSHDTIQKTPHQTLPGLSSSYQDVTAASHPQYFLKKATCEYAFEEDLFTEKEATGLSKRLRSLLSKGSLSIYIQHKPLSTLQSATSPNQPLHWSEVLWSLINPYLGYSFFLFSLLFSWILGLWSWRKLGRTQHIDEEYKNNTSNKENIDLPLTENTSDKHQDISSFTPSLPTAIERWLQSKDYEKIRGVKSLITQNTWATTLRSLCFSSRLQIQSIDFLKNTQPISDETLQQIHHDLEHIHATFDERIETIRYWQYILDPDSALTFFQHIGFEWGSRILSLCSPLVVQEWISKWPQDLSVAFTNRLITGVRLAEQDLTLLADALQKFTTDDIDQTDLQNLLRMRNPRSSGEKIDCTDIFGLFLRKIPKQDQIQCLDKIDFQTCSLQAQDVFTPRSLLSLPKTILHQCVLQLPIGDFAGWLHKTLSPSDVQTLLHEAPQSLQKALSSPSKHTDSSHIESSIIEVLQGMLNHNQINIKDLVT